MHLPQNLHKPAWRSIALEEEFPNYGPRAKFVPRIHFFRSAKPFCQWWKTNVFTKILQNVAYPETIQYVRCPALELLCNIAYVGLWQKSLEAPALESQPQSSVEKSRQERQDALSLSFHGD